MNIQIPDNYHGNDWKEHGALLIVSKIQEAISKKGFCNFMLTGGSTAKGLYEVLRPKLNELGPIHFYWGDERFLPETSPDNNFNMAMNTLFQDGVRVQDKLFPIRTNFSDSKDAASCYNKLLIEEMDVLLLSMGSDCHIASLFPHSDALKTVDKKAQVSEGPLPYKSRITITKQVLDEAKNIFLMVTGLEKGLAATKAFQESESILSCPVKLVLNRFWLMDEDAYGAMISASEKKR